VFAAQQYGLRCKHILLLFFDGDGRWCCRAARRCWPRASGALCADVIFSVAGRF